MIDSYETMPQPAGALPEFGGDPSRWQADVRVLWFALRHREGYEFQAQLPEVVGYLTPDEAAAMDTWGEMDQGFSNEAGTMHQLRAQLPNAFATMEDDYALLTNGRGRLVNVEVEKKFTHAGTHARGAGALHVDELVRQRSEVTDVQYLVANLEPTVFYAGPARLYAQPGRVLSLDPRSVDPNGLHMAAPPLAIVRTTGATVHGSPEFRADGFRAWLRAFASEGR